MGHIFISYSHTDKDYVDKLHEALERKGFKVWRDVQIESGAEWLKVIEKNLDECDALIVVMSKGSSESDMVQNEVERARRKKKKIFPLLLDGDTWLNIQTTQYTDVRSKSLPTEEFYNALRIYALNDVIIELNIDFSKKITKWDIIKIIMKVKEIIEEANNYPLAKGIAETCLPKIEKYGNIPELQTKIQLFKIWYAHALMYIGDTGNALAILKEAINKLQEMSPAENHDDYRTWCEALGRAHNHIGYINWLDFGCLERAGKEFLEAISYFLRVKAILRSELATAYDNFGRVYSQLGYSTYAEIIIDNGKQIRNEFNDEARLPLSLDSMAIAYLDAGQPNRALKFSEEALSLSLKHYEKTGKGSRRIGLALLTKGRALRRLGGLEYTGGIYKTSSFEENLKLLSEAKEALDVARDNFERAQEKIRLFQVDNELACVLRERAKISKMLGKTNASDLVDLAEEDIKKSLQHLGVTSNINDNKDEQIETFIQEAFTYLDKIKTEDKWKYRLYILDSCEDLARAWFTVDSEPDKIKSLIDTALKSIPKEYDIQDSDFSKTSIEIQNEEYWQQIGKLYALWGEACFKNDWPAATENYILATSYFGLFRQRSEKTNIFPTFKPELASHRALTIKIHNDLKTLSPKDLKVLREEKLVSFETKNPQISADWYQDFKDILGLVDLEKHPLAN